MTAGEGGRKLIAFPGLQLQRAGGWVSIANPHLDSVVKASQSVCEVLEYFKRPRAVADFFAQYEAPSNVLESLETQLVLIDPAMVDIVRKTRARPTEPSPITFAAAPARALSDAEAEPRPRYGVLGVPLDSGTMGLAGTREGPREVRRQMEAASFSAGYVFTDVDRRVTYPADLPVADFGNVVCLAGESIEVTGQRITYAVDRLLGAGIVPVTIGGDHSITAPIADALARHHRAFGLVHFDAHPDFGTLSVKPLNHANVMGHVIRHREVKRLLQIGLRKYQFSSSGYPAPVERRVKAITACEAQRLTPGQLLAQLPASMPYYVTFDVDAINPAEAPSTGTPVPGGLSFHLALELLLAVVERRRVIGFDFVEVAASAASQNATAALVGHLMLKAMFAHRGGGKRERSPSFYLPRE